VTASTNQDWLQARTSRFLLEEEGCRLSFQLDSRSLREPRTNARILLEAGNGERETLVLEVRRGGVSPRRIAAAILGLLAVLGAGNFLGLVPDELLFGTQSHLDSVVPGLTLQINPAPDVLLLDGNPIDPALREISPAQLPQARAFTLEAQRKGFGTRREMISMRRGDSRHLVLELPLLDPMDFVRRPRDRALADPGQVAPATAEAIDTAKPALRRCLTALEPIVSDLRIEVVLHPEGHIQGLKLLGETGVGSESLPCLRRVLRALETPVFKADYAVMEHPLFP
jgi:hypothetical protein